MSAMSRPLPTVIGPTENALRALLVSVLGASPIATYEEWVTLNGLARLVDGDALDPIADGLQRPRADVAEIVAGLERRGLVERGRSGWGLTTEGAELLARLRVDVGAATARLVDEIDDDDVAITRQVLDTVRRRAIAELDHDSERTSGR